VAPVAWEPCGTDSCWAGERLVYMAPVPSPKSTGGPFGLLSLVRTPSMLSGALFVSKPSSAGAVVDDAMRLGNATGMLGLAWRSAGSGTLGAPLLGLTRSSDGSLSLRAIDPDSGRTEDLRTELPKEVAPGATVIGLRWDLTHARLVVLARPKNVDTPAQPTALDAWLVDFRDVGDHTR
jgi:hypothetical protein